MFSKKNVEHYSKRVAEEAGMPKKDVHQILSYMMRNLCKMIERGEDIRIKGFGRIYFEKRRTNEQTNT